MEAGVGGKVHNFFGPVVSDLKAVEKKGMEWDLNDWKWDGDLFTAASLNSLPLDCRNRQFIPIGSEILARESLRGSPCSGSDETDRGNEKGKREIEKRRRAVVVEDGGLNDASGSFNLKLGGQTYPITDGEAENWEGKTGKKSKVVGVATTLNRAVCQVEDCRADLCNAKDYHRRHKVCESHSKANKALVGNVMQRFCQQCSRFHILQEFDEGRRSCRRRLAGHNRRRRKTHPENVVNPSSPIDERSSSYLLISLLRILSNMHSGSSESSDQTRDQDLLSHLLKNLASLAGTANGMDISGLLRGSQDLQNIGTSIGTLAKNGIFADDARGEAPQLAFASLPNILIPTKESVPTKAHNKETKERNYRLSNIDLNDVYDDSQDYAKDRGSGSPDCPLWVQQRSDKSSPPQTSGNSGSTSTHFPSTSSGEAPSRTDRIVFKLFGKDPSDLPLVLRKQILDWLSHSPTEIESYIRPGCIILTIYLRLEKSTWEQLCCDLSSSLSRLLNASNDPFWRTGWVYARVRHHVAFIYNGQIVVDTELSIQSHKRCRISSINPIAISVSDRAQFSVKGFNMSRPTTRLLCALEGKYLVQESCSDMMEGGDTFIGNDGIQNLSFLCCIPNVTGRGFIEVEDHCLSSSFFPFIVAEQDVCSEVCTLQSAIEEAETADEIHGFLEKTEAKNQALEFIQEMGWLLHRAHTRFRLGPVDPNSDLFPFKRFRWLMEFSMDRDWSAVVKKLLGILFKGTVDAGDHSSVELALNDMGLLHRAVQRNCRSMVDSLLRYVPHKVLDKSGSEQNLLVDGSYIFLFRPDVVGPGNLTPLHIAACKDGSESVLDALTDDPGSVGIEAWKNARDNTGLTPKDYAYLQGRFSYINMVQKKINKKSGSGHVVLDIPGVLKSMDGLRSAKVASFDAEKIEKNPIQRNCKLCEKKMSYGNTGRSLAIYRPAMLSMVAIAAVCVCVALLFKSSPEVLYIFRPFRWELLEYGTR